MYYIKFSHLVSFRWMLRLPLLTYSSIPVFIHFRDKQSCSTLLTHVLTSCTGNSRHHCHSLLSHPLASLALSWFYSATADNGLPGCRIAVLDSPFSLWLVSSETGPIPFLISSDVEAPLHDRPAFANGFIYAFLTMWKATHWSRHYANLWHWGEEWAIWCDCLQSAEQTNTQKTEARKIKNPSDWSNLMKDLGLILRPVFLYNAWSPIASMLYPPLGFRIHRVLHVQ